MPQAIHALDYLEQSPAATAAVTVLFGTEWVLRQMVLTRIRKALLGEQEDTPYHALDGEELPWRDVADELATKSLFQTESQRLIVVRDADNFVSENRAALEKYTAHPSRHAVLILLVSSFPATTRLYKQIVKDHLAIDCRVPEKSAGSRKVPDEQRIVRWLSAHAKAAHGVNLPRAVAELLCDMVGADMSRMDQELAKLSAFAAPADKITTDMVIELVGGWRAKTAWEMIDAALDGDAGPALEQLDRLLRAGEHPIALLAQMSWSLRQMAAATRIIQRSERQGKRLPLRSALQEAGVGNWQGKLEKGEKNLRQVGRHRGAQLYRWLVEADLSLKGSHSPDKRARWVLERLLLRLAKQPS
jgi:DNA polymerase III subunit delta